MYVTLYIILELLEGVRHFLRTPGSLPSFPVFFPTRKKSPVCAKVEEVSRGMVYFVAVYMKYFVAT